MTKVAVAGALLAGGRSTRFGSDKLRAILPGSSERLAEHSAAALRASGCEPLAWVAPQAAQPPLRETRGFHLLVDSAQGPLGALALALAWAQEQNASHLLVLAADLPLIRGRHLSALMSAAGRGEPHQAYCAKGPDGRPEPLCAVYPANWANEARLRFADGQRAARAVWFAEPVLVELGPTSPDLPVAAKECSPEVTVSVTVPSDGRVTIHPCFNLNDQEDWEQLQRWSKEGELS